MTLRTELALAKARVKELEARLRLLQESKATASILDIIDPRVVGELQARYGGLPSATRLLAEAELILQSVRKVTVNLSGLKFSVRKAKKGGSK